MNPSMWLAALRIIPRINKTEWDNLDIISRWLIATRAAVLVMTFLSAAIAGILAVQHGTFHGTRWLLVTLGLILAHATNNLLNDFTDSVKGVDKDNYFRAQYGPQTLEHGLLSKKQLLTYALVTGALAAAIGAYLILDRGGLTWLFFLLGVVFVLFYTFPLKYIALGEIAVLLVWGPLMVGGGYYVITGAWDWNVALASLPYALGVTTVIFGKHIDKLGEDRKKRIFTLPVLLGEKLARLTGIALALGQYLFVIYLVLADFFTPVLLITLLALPLFLKTFLPMFQKPKPASKPADYPATAWPLWFVASAFIHNRRFGVLYLLGLIVETVLRSIFAA